MRFPVSGVETPLWLPPLVAFVISYFTSMGGVSGAFLLLPFQMSYLGFTSPAVSATNLVYNIVSIPSGIYRYLREGRMIWPLAAAVVIGTLPGIILGGCVRLIYLTDPRHFKVFVACVLAYLGVRLLLDAVTGSRGLRDRPSGPAAGSNSESWRVRVLECTWRRLVFSFREHEYRPPLWGIFVLSLVVGVLGGIYGVGGGAILAPFFVAVLGLPVHAVAGAALLGTFVTSAAGALFYQAASHFNAFGLAPALAVAPDWQLGALFGLGGMAGMYLGARTQRYVPARWIKWMLGVLILFVAARYLAEVYASG